MTNRRLASFDRGAHAAFSLGGLADAGNFTPRAGGPSIACRVFVDRAAEVYGTQTQVQDMRTTITCFASEVGGRPSPGARFTIGSEVFTVDELDARTDESRYVCIVKAGY